VLRVACSQIPGATKPELRPPAVINATRTWRLGLYRGPAAPRCVVRGGIRRKLVCERENTTQLVHVNRTLGSLVIYIMLYPVVLWLRYVVPYGEVKTTHGVIWNYYENMKL
jgi:hypothetical protein